MSASTKGPAGYDEVAPVPSHGERVTPLDNERLQSVFIASIFGGRISRPIACAHELAFLLVSLGVVPANCVPSLPNDQTATTNLKQTSLEELGNVEETTVCKGAGESPPSSGSDLCVSAAS